MYNCTCFACSSLCFVSPKSKCLIWKWGERIIKPWFDKIPYSNFNNCFFIPYAPAITSPTQPPANIKQAQRFYVRTLLVLRKYWSRYGNNVVLFTSCWSSAMLSSFTKRVALTKYLTRDPGRTPLVRRLRCILAAVAPQCFHPGQKEACCPSI